MPVSKQQIPTLSDRDLGLIATAADDTYPDEIVLAVWEELAARGLVVDFIEQSPLLRETQTDDLLTVATFRNYVHAQLAQTRLLTSGILAFLFDDNTIRMNWFWATALGFVKLRVPTVEAVEALEILGLDPGDWGRIDGIMNAATVVRARVGTPSRARGGPYRVWGQSLVRTQVCRGDPQVDIP